jgi:CRP-like cAMP-binding protein
MGNSSDNQLTHTEKTLKFFSKFRVRNFTKNEVIIDPNVPNDNVFFIVSGRIKKYSVNYKGDEVVMTVFRRGSFIPITESIGQKLKNRFYYAADSEKVETRVAPDSDVQKMLIDNPDVMLALLHRVNRALDEFLGRALALMASSALSRVAYEIYTEAKRFGIREASDIIISLNERSIAARTGLTRETVNREIRKLKEIQAVRVERRGIIVTDLTKLETKLYKKLL